MGRGYYDVAESGQRCSGQSPLLKDAGYERTASESETWRNRPHRALIDFSCVCDRVVLTVDPCRSRSLEIEPGEGGTSGLVEKPVGEWLARQE